MFPIDYQYTLTLLSSAILGFFLSNYFAEKHGGEKLEWSFRIKLGGYRMHLRHWAWSLILLGGCLGFHFYEPTTLGILAGSMIQGFTYKDWYLIFYKANNFQKIYSKIMD
jgi:hypothetical protein